MKKIFLTLGLFLGITAVMAQAPEGIKYQAVVRDAGQAIISNQSIGVRVKLLQGGPTGTAVYTETHNANSNSFGLINFSIGEGSVVSGNFASIDWSLGNYFVEVATDNTGGTNYVVMGTSKMMSVPYALYAKTSGSGGSGGNQTLSLVGDQLSISGGNTVSLNAFESHWGEVSARTENLSNTGVTVQGNSDTVLYVNAVANPGAATVYGGLIDITGNQQNQRAFGAEATATSTGQTNIGGAFYTEGAANISYAVIGLSNDGNQQSFGGWFTGSPDAATYSAAMYALSETDAGTNVALGSRGAVGDANNSTTFNIGVQGFATGTAGGENYGVYGYAGNSTGNNYGVFGSTANPGGFNDFAGYFDGDVTITGNLDVTGFLSKGGGTFKIDHPLDPENKYLIHSFVESPDMLNIFNGNITTDADGFATVELPEYCEAANKEFRYQLTVIGSFAQAIIKEEVAGNKFIIQTNQPNVKVSWQVTGIRNDKWSQENRVEPEKEKTEKGTYLHPELYGMPKEKSENFKHTKNQDVKKKAPAKENKEKISK